MRRNRRLPRSREWLIECCRRMLLIRHFEETLVAVHDQGHFSGHYHLYIGQEATGVAALSCVEPNDCLFTTHRNHGHLLARGADPGRLFAEILGRKDGYNKGKGGTFRSFICARTMENTVPAERQVRRSRLPWRPTRSPICPRLIKSPPSRWM